MKLEISLLILSRFMLPLNIEISIRLSSVEKITDKGRMDGQTDGRDAALHAAHKEGRVISKHFEDIRPVRTHCVVQTNKVTGSVRK